MLSALYKGHKNIIIIGSLCELISNVFGSHHPRSLSSYIVPLQFNTNLLPWQPLLPTPLLALFLLHSAANLSLCNLQFSGPVVVQPVEQSLRNQDLPPPPSSSRDHTQSGEAEAKGGSSEHKPEHEKAISEGALDVDRVPSTAEGGSHQSKGDSLRSSSPCLHKARNGQAGTVKDETTADGERTLASVATVQSRVTDEITQKAEGSEEQPAEGKTSAVEMLKSSAADVVVLGSKSEPKLATGEAKEDDNLRSQSVAVITETTVKGGMAQTESEGEKNTEGLKSASSTSLTKAKRNSSPTKSKSGESLKSSSQTHLKSSSTTQLIGTKSHESVRFGSSTKLSRSRESLKAASQVYSSKSRESLKKLDSGSKLSSKSRESLKNSDGKKKMEQTPAWVKDENTSTKHTETLPKESKSAAAETPPTASDSAQEAEKQPVLGDQKPVAEQPTKETVGEARLKDRDSKTEQHEEDSSAGKQDSSELQPNQGRSTKQLEGGKCDDEHPLVVDTVAGEESKDKELHAPAQNTKVEIKRKPSFESEPTQKHSVEGLATSKESTKLDGDGDEGRPADVMDRASEPLTSDPGETEVGKREEKHGEKSNLQSKSGEPKAANVVKRPSQGDDSGSKSSLRGSRVKLISTKPGGSGSKSSLNSKQESIMETSKEKGEMTNLNKETEVKVPMEKQGIDKRTGQSESSIVEAVEKLNGKAETESEPQAAEPPKSGEVTASA